MASLPGREIVDLSYDSEEEAARSPEFFDAQDLEEGFEDELLNLDTPVTNFGEHFNAGDPETIDLTAIPDIDVPPSDPILIDNDDPQPLVGFDDFGNIQLVTVDACLHMVLGVLPDISIDHALGIIQEKTIDASRTIAQCQQVVSELLDGGAYPKEADEVKNKKRKRDDDNDLSDHEIDEQDYEIAGYKQDALDLLKDEFPTIPVRHFTNVLKQHKTLFKSFGVLEEQLRNYRQVARPFSKIAKARVKRGTENILIERGSRLPKELHRARKKSEEEAEKRSKAEEVEKAEKANLQQAQMNNEMGDCSCCFTDEPLNRMISCNGETTHFYCLECPRKQVETLMGQSRCRITCFGVSDCTGFFSRRQLQQVLPETTFERLEHMQQMEDLKAAGLDFLSECPFCDFKMECPPIEIDKEFRCQSSKCGKTSCRTCQKESHIPLSCEEAKKDGQITLRHIVEEAMSAALIRQCNKCKHPFIKESGCNKMTCTHCRNLQCYVCSKNVTDYNHFGEERAGKCPLHENVEDRHEQEIKMAADEAMARVRADNPGLSDADLMVQVSDKVKQAEDIRRGRAIRDVDAFPYHMVGNVLQNRNAPVPGGALPPAPPPEYAYLQGPVPGPVGFQQLHHGQHLPQLIQPPIGYPLAPQQPFQPARRVDAVINMPPGVRLWVNRVPQHQLDGAAPNPPAAPNRAHQMHPGFHAEIDRLDQRIDQIQLMRQQNRRQQLQHQQLQQQLLQQQNDNERGMRLLRLQQANEAMAAFHAERQRRQMGNRR